MSSLKKTIVVLSIFVTVTVALSLTLFFLGQRYSETILNEVIKRETNGYYQLDFSSLELDIFDSRITVRSLKLSPDSTQNFAELGLNNVYEIALEELIIDLESLYDLYIDKELNIKNVRVVDPDIQMISLNNAKKTKFSFEAGSMYKAISDYLQVLKIDYFRIQDGELQYDGNRFALGEIDFLVKNLLMDSVSRENQVFYSEQIELEIRNQSFRLPDSIHQITFGKFVLSTSDSILSFEDIRVRPTDASGVTFDGENDINVYDIQVPKLSFKGVDYVAAYQNNHLIIDELHFEEPTVFVDDESHTKRAKKDTDNSLLALIFQVFGALDIGKLSIKDAHLDLKINGEKYQRFKVEESDIVFHHIHLDTTNFRFDHRFKYFEDIELDIQNYTYLLPDSVHTAHFDLLNINSFDSRVILENLLVDHERAGNESKALVDVDIPFLVLENIDFQRAIVDKVLNVGVLQLDEGLISIKNTGSAKKKSLASVRKIHQAVAPFFREISINQMGVSDLQLNMPKNINVEGIQLDLTDINLNAASSSFQRLFNQIDLEIGSFVLDQDSIKVEGEKLFIKDKMKSFQLIGWSTDVKTKNQEITARFDTLEIGELVIDSVLSGQYGAFEKIMLINPVADFAIHSSSKNGPMDLGLEKELIIKGGEIRGSIDSTRVSMTGLDADIFIGDSTAFRSMETENIIVNSQELGYLIQIDRWMYDTLNSEMDFEGVFVSPLNPDMQTGTQFRGKIPLVQITAFEQSKFFDEKHFYADSVNLHMPNIRISGNKQASNQAQAEKESDLTINIQTLTLEDGNIKAVGLESGLDSIHIKGVNSSINGIDYPRKGMFEKGVLYSDLIELEVKQVLPFFQNGDSLSLGSTSFSSNTNDIAVDSINYRAADKSLLIDLPKLSLRNLNIEELATEQRYILDSLIINDLSMEAQFGAKKESGSSFNKYLDVGHIGLQNVSFIGNNIESGKRYELPQVDISVDGLRSQDTLTLSSFLRDIDQMSLNSAAFTIPMEDSYSLDLESLQMHYPKNNLTLQGLHLKSELSAIDYSSKLEFQNDWFDVVVDSTQISGFDLQRMVDEKVYQTRRIDLSGLDALIYRDKEVPFPEDQVRELPHAIIRNVEAKFQIDSILVNGRVRYREKPKDYDRYGEISFDESKFQLLNVGNMDSRPNALMLLNAKGLMMGDGEFQVNGTFNLNSPENIFSLRGSVLDFPLDSMNRMLGPVANVNIKSGYAKELEFNFKANNDRARGEMRFRYNDLKVQILNVKTHDTQGFGQGIKTFFANAFVVKNKNPSYLVFLRKGTIFNERDTSRAIFNYWGKSLLSGVVSSIGVHKSDKAEKKFERSQTQSVGTKEE